MAAQNLPAKQDDSEITQLKEVPQVLTKLFKTVLKENVDYGQIPGTPKPSLWKPGAELLSKYFRYTTGDMQIEKTENLDRPYFAYVIQVPIYDERGVWLCTGVGAANTGESRYALRIVYQADEGKLTDEEKKKLISKRTKDGVKKYLPTSPDEIFTLQNTVLKMAKKRAFVDAVLAATGADRIFTQDMDEDHEEAVEKAKPVGASVAQSNPPAPESFSQVLSRQKFVTHSNDPDREFCYASREKGKILPELQPLVDKIRAEGKVELSNGEALYVLTFDESKERIYRAVKGGLDPS